MQISGPTCHLKRPILSASVSAANVAFQKCDFWSFARCLQRARVHHLADLLQLGCTLVPRNQTETHSDAPSGAVRHVHTPGPACHPECPHKAARGATLFHTHPLHCPHAALHVNRHQAFPSICTTASCGTDPVASDHLLETFMHWSQNAR